MPLTPLRRLGTRAADDLSPREQETLLARLGRQSWQGTSNLLYALDTPRAILASGIDYLQDGKWNNPFDSEQRVDSEQLLEQAGWKDDTTARWAAGLGLDIVTDPLTLLSPFGALTKGAKAARAAGILDNAATVASKQLRSKTLSDAVAAAGTGLDDAAVAALTPKLPGRAQRTLTALKTNLRDYAEHSTRPLVGTQEARRSMTLDGLMQAVPAEKTTAVTDALNAYLTKNKLKLDDIKDMPLGQQVDFGLGNMTLTGDLFGKSVGDSVARGVDRFGEAIRWSPAGRVSHALINKAAGGQTDAVAQAAALRINEAADVSGAKGRREAAELADYLRTATIDPAVAQRTGIDNVMDSKAGEAIDRFMEGNAATANDIDFVTNTPGVRKFVDEWGTLSGKVLGESEKAGLRSHVLKHAYGANYRPYQLENVLDQAAGSKKAKTALFDTVTGDMLKRSKSLQLPGGIDQLRKLSTDRRFVGLGDAFVEDDIANALYKEINDPTSQYYVAMADSPVGQAAAKTAADRAAARAAASAAWASGTMSTAAEKAALRAAAAPAAGYSKSKARQLARFLHSLDVPKAGDISPVFGNHPLEATAKYVYGRERAIGTADELINTIASRLVNKTAGQVSGGRHVSALSALQKAGLRSAPDPITKVRGGAAMKLRERMSAILKETGHNIAPDDIKLSEYAMPLETLNQLTRMHDVFASPKAVGEIGEYIEQYTRMFKTGVLTWPSRYTRDLTSGFISNLIEAGPEAIKGGYYAAKMLNGQYDKVIPYLKQMPLYANVPDDEIISRFLKDSAESGILKGGVAIDRTHADRTAETIKELLPGFKPSSIAKSFAGDPSRTYGQFALDAMNPFGIKGVMGNKDTTNPLYKTGEALGEWTDAVNRLAGYMALLKSQALAPAEAASRMTAAHVDYSNLSAVEKQIRAWVPFYSYESRIGKYAAKKLVDRSSGYRNVLRTADKLQQSDDDTYTPPNISERSGFMLPTALGKVTEQMGLGNLVEPGPGLRRAITNIDLPGRSALDTLSIAKLAGEFDLNESLSSTAQNVASKLGPLPKTAIEYITQRDMFTKRKLGESASEIDTMIGAAIGDEDYRVPSTIQAAADILLPGQGRLLSVGKSLTDQRTPLSSRVGTTLLNAFSPVKFATVDQQRQRSDAMRQLGRDIERYPGAEEFSTTSIAKEDVEKLPPDMRQNYLLRQALQKQSREAAKKKKDAAKRAARFGL